MNKKVPKLKNDKDDEKFLGQDLTDDINLKNFISVNFEMLPKDKQVNLRFSEQLLSAVRQKADQEGISYQKYIRKAVEQSLSSQWIFLASFCNPTNYLNYKAMVPEGSLAEVHAGSSSAHLGKGDAALSRCISRPSGMILEWQKADQGSCPQVVYPRHSPLSRHQYVSP